MATPMTTVTTDAMTAREKVLPSQKCSTRQTNGMMSSLAICTAGRGTVSHSHGAEKTCQGVTQAMRNADHCVAYCWYQ